MFNNSKNDTIPKWAGGEKVQDTKAALFKRLYGVKPDTFSKMLSILQKEFDGMHKSGGKPPKLKPEDKLYVTLKYLGVSDNGQHCSGIWCVQRHSLFGYPMGRRNLDERRHILKKLIFYTRLTTYKWLGGLPY